MLIKSANFVTSAAKPSQWPDHQGPEVAFAGRSNVGKSSLINTLLGRRNLVKTSSRPGRTQLINFFSINGDFMLVDLPGYGYAKVPKAVRKTWLPMIEKYLLQRPNLRAVVALMDMRHLPTANDHDLLAWLEHHRLAYRIVLTKADKLSGNKRRNQLRKIAAALAMAPEKLSVFSAKTGQGKQELWTVIENWLGG